MARLTSYGWQAYNDRDYQEAEFFFRKALELAPDYSEALYGLSWVHFKTGSLAQAKKGFRALFQKGYRKRECGSALFYLYMKQGQKQMARKFLSFLPKKEQEKYGRILTANERVKKRPKVSKQSKKHRSNKFSEDFFLFAKHKNWQKVLEISRKLPRTVLLRADVQKVLAWALLNENRTQESKSVFEGLLIREPLNEEVAYGLAISCFRLEDLDCMKSLCAHFEKNRRIRNLFCQLIQKQITALYDRHDYSGVLRLFAQTSNLSCKEQEKDIKELVAWSAFKSNKFKTSAKLFRELFLGGYLDKSIKFGLYESLNRLEDEEQLWEFVGKLARSRDPSARKLAADFYYQRGLVDRADLTFPDNTAIYYNVGTTSIETGYTYSYIKGDSGTSRLRFQEIPRFQIRHHLNERISVSLGGSNLLLQSGPAGDNPWLGTPTKGPAIHSAYPSVNGFLPFVTFDYQDRLHLTGKLSSTPLGTPVKPLPLFEFSFIKSGHHHKVTLFQKSVTRSILSWVGQRDPYTGKKWGRVASTGILVHTSMGLSSKWWLSVEGKYAHLWGRNLWQNTEISGTVAIGKSISKNVFQDISYGIFSQFMHFDRNSDFYTYGHGGYFSPQFFVACGPFLRLTTTQGKRWLTDISTSLAYLNYYEKGSAYYPISSSLGGSYRSNQSSKIGYTLDFAAGYLFSHRLMGKVRFHLNRSADFQDSSVGAFITFFFGGRKGILLKDLASTKSYLFN